MTQPTQNLLPARKTPVSDTPQQPSDATPFGGRVSISGRDDVQCLRDRARQLGTATTIFPRAQACPTPPKGLLMHQIRRTKMREGRPETSISVTPLAA